jgi:hypothetical protein
VTIAAADHLREWGNDHTDVDGLRVVAGLPGRG